MMRRSIRSKTKPYKGKREHQDTLYAINEAARLACLCAKLRAKSGLGREPMDADGGWYAYALLGLVDPDDIHADAM